MLWSYSIALLITIGFAAIMTAGWFHRLPGFGPRPGTPGWQRAISTFLTVLVVVTLQYIGTGRTTQAFVTFLFGLLAIAVVEHAERVYLRRKASDHQR